MTLTLTTAGESHGPALVAILTGLPAGLVLDRTAIDADLHRRQLGYGRSPRQQLEQDEVEGGLESVNTLVIRDGRVLGSSTDTEALGDRRPKRAAVIGAGGAATAWIAELEARGAEVDVFARKGEWPPQTGDAELVVHATPVNDDLLFEPRPGQTVIDLAYRAEGGETAHAAAARAAGSELIDGLDVLVAQGAASFALWTGVPGPVDVMRAAVRSPA